jgi:hypothetical protein
VIVVNLVVIQLMAHVIVP